MGGFRDGLLFEDGVLKLAGSNGQIARPHIVEKGVLAICVLDRGRPAGVAVLSLEFVRQILGEDIAVEVEFHVLDLEPIGVAAGARTVVGDVAELKNDAWMQ